MATVHIPHAKIPRLRFPVCDLCNQSSESVWFTADPLTLIGQLINGYWRPRDTIKQWPDNVLDDPGLQWRKINCRK